MASPGPLTRDVLETLDDVVRRTFARLDGLTDAEYLWEPVAGCLSVRAGAGGVFRADARPAAGSPRPAAFTTIAWRTWHIGADCLRGFCRFFEGGVARGDEWQDWPGTAAGGVRMLAEDWSRFRAGVAALGDARLGAPMGAIAGPFAHESYLLMALHALDEGAHHGGELGVLRDLYECGFAGPPG